ncbi:MAG: sigma 54-interacting transcriptional regulator [Chromatiaceae bacterium]|nr:sigma 54-interacting transcriptional regulator [Chromatiaceae bacterium]
MWLQSKHPRRRAPDLAGLDTGDARMSAAIARARRALRDNISLLIEGEPGTGKGMLARAIHHGGSWRDGPFVSVNCAALDEPALETDLFGTEGTGPGRLAQAHSGVLVLHNVEHLPARLQARLLQCLESRAVAHIGAPQPLPADIYVIATTDSSLREHVQEGAFRTDLYYRLDRLLLRVPPLRERTDIAALIDDWLVNRNATGKRLEISDDVMAVFRDHPWPGNVRQLFNVLQAAAAMVDVDAVIRREHLPEDFWDDIGNPPPTRDAGDVSVESLQTMESRAIREAVEAHGGNLSSAARALGVSRATLYRKLRHS